MSQGETPGDRVRKIAKELESSITQDTHAVSEVRLQYGTQYGDDTTTMQKSDGTTAHAAGYFELTNKSDEVIAVRLCEGPANAFYECSRPSYITVLPYECVSGMFDPTLTLLEMSVLTNNPAVLDTTKPVVIDTNKNKAEDITPSVAIRNFQDFSLYRTTCTLKNCVVKYKGSEWVEPRTGSTSKMKKMLSFNKKSSANRSILDFATNVSEVEKYYSSRAVRL
jgi:hypothetical protein